MKGPDAIWNRIFCCPNCHARVYVVGATGTHGIIGTNPIVIELKTLSTGGHVVLYAENGDSKVSILKNEYKGTLDYLRL
jgi:hypothetical protein